MQYRAVFLTWPSVKAVDEPMGDGVPAPWPPLPMDPEVFI